MNTTFSVKLNLQTTFTDRCKSTIALSHCSTASNEPNNKKEGSNCNDDHCWDKSVHVFKEMIVVIICNEDIGSHVAQDTSSGLGVTHLYMLSKPMLKGKSRGTSMKSNTT